MATSLAGTFIAGFALVDLRFDQHPDAHHRELDKFIGGVVSGFDILAYQIFDILCVYVKPCHVVNGFLPFEVKFVSWCFHNKKIV